MSGNDFDSQVAIVTGAGSGIGQACAQMLAQRGAKVLIADRNVGAAERVASAIGSNAMAFAVDVADPTDCQAMTKTGGGSIVNMSSILGIVGFANAGAYVAAKHGVVGLTQTAALDHAADGIRVNAVGPGFIDTPLLAQLSVEMKAGIAAMHPRGKMGSADEVAELVTFLASEHAANITGSYYTVDGGYTAR
jgi:NAD(P)-dependent dehydrogenase (short-subunit alcohol dehydrogenase family)